MHYNYYKLFIIFFNNITIYITKRKGNIIPFLAKILSTYYIAIIGQYYREKRGTNYKIIVYFAKYIGNIEYICMEFPIELVRLNLNNNTVCLFL